MQVDRKRIIELKTKPQSVENLLELARLSYSINNIPEATHSLLEIIKNNENIEAYSLLGQIYLDQGELQLANQYFTYALKIDPNFIESYFGLIITHLLLKNYTTALDYINNAKAIDPEDKRITLLELIYDMETYRILNAENTIESLSSVDLPTKAQVLFDFYKARIQTYRRNNNAALEAFNGIKDREPFSVPESYNSYCVKNNIGICYIRMKNYDAAKNEFSQLISTIDKNNRQNIDKRQLSIILLNYAMALWLNGEHEATLSLFERINKLDKEYYPFYNSVKEYVQSKGEIVKTKAAKLRKESKKRGINYGFYLGCIIPNRYPMDELATRVVFDYLDIGVDELKGASCCPAPGVFRGFDIPTWLSLGARNICLSEELDRDLVTMCNGCYGSLLEVNHKLQHDSKEKAVVNETLKKINKEYMGTKEVLHVLEVFYHKLGLEEVKKYIVRKLDLKVAVHYGCHILKSSETRPWGGETENPRFFEEIIELTGCKTLEYKDKLMCCGAGGGLRSAVKEVAMDFTREKLENVRKVGADALIVCCPFCQLQFDLGQNEVNKVFADVIGEPFSIPIIYVTQLIGLAFGLDPVMLGLQRFKMAGLPPFQPIEQIFLKPLDIDMKEKLNLLDLF